MEALKEDNPHKCTKQSSSMPLKTDRRWLKKKTLRGRQSQRQSAHKGQWERERGGKLSWRMKITEIYGDAMFFRKFTEFLSAEQRHRLNRLNETQTKS